jgi:hypothetical protein
MARWVCPKCRREFGRGRQPHECTPALPLADYFERAAPFERPIFESLMAFLRKLGPVYVEPVFVGIFIKSSRSFIQLRPKRKWVALWFSLPHRIDHPRIARRIKGSGDKTFHVVNLWRPEDLDDVVKDWLAESYAYCTDE